MVFDNDSPKRKVHEEETIECDDDIFTEFNESKKTLMALQNLGGGLGMAANKA